ncbi:putative dachshund [Cocos nucifera]|nr:putative dachshund [Cocos nucifera]
MSPMRTEVRALARILSGYKKEDREEKGERERDLITLNLLGSGPIGVGSGDLDLDFRVSPPGLENRRDLLSDKIKPSPAPARRELQDLNLPPASGDAPPLEDSASLDLNIVTPPASGYPSICTLESVNSALERAERESRDKARQEGRMDGSPSSSSSSAATNSSMKRSVGDERRGGDEGVDGSDSSRGSLMAAGCPSCLLYVLVAKRDPRCPRCGSHVPAPAFYKKPRVHF